VYLRFSPFSSPPKKEGGDFILGKGRVLKFKKEVHESSEEALQQFLWWKQAEGVSTRTREDYKLHVTMFYKRYPGAWRNPKGCKREVFEYMGQNIKPATYNLRLIYLRAFFAWCIKEGLLTENPFIELKKRKTEDRIVNLDGDTLKKLITLPDGSTFVGVRDYALILLTLDTGIRPKEAFSLLINDINYQLLEVYIRPENAKTRVSRTLPILPVTAKAIHDLTSSRHLSWGSNVPVFCSTEGNPLNRYTWGDRFEIYSKTLGVKILPYHLRHAFALQFLRNGGNAFALQRTLGHTDLTMTKRYVALTQQDIKEQHTMASPLNTLLPQKHRIRKLK
jgi:site-specific recombinase XerD